MISNEFFPFLATAIIDLRVSPTHQNFSTTKSKLDVSWVLFITREEDVIVMEALEEHKKDTRQRLVMIKSRVNEMHLDFWKTYRTPSALWGWTKIHNCTSAWAGARRNMLKFRNANYIGAAFNVCSKTWFHYAYNKIVSRSR